MKREMLSWRCPLCSPEDAEFVRGSQEHLDMAIASHIITHEQRAALRAVDRARLECPEAACAIGRKNHVNLSIGSDQLKLSDFDKSWLQGMRIQPE